MYPKFGLIKSSKTPLLGDPLEERHPAYRDKTCKQVTDKILTDTTETCPNTEEVLAVELLPHHRCRATAPPPASLCLHSSVGRSVFHVHSSPSSWTALNRRLFRCPLLTIYRLLWNVLRLEWCGS
ncbi:unnamed protein product [Nezara viridula]|uniref:Uncharacterized protein n=1 Tax=Nezara viridula TaxID=85310 RepID=A0A9P0E902_NEZVI|nr:unnamed protein product [Nezara viridula]